VVNDNVNESFPHQDNPLGRKTQLTPLLIRVTVYIWVQHRLVHYDLTVVVNQKTMVDITVTIDIL
jgi:hypothetical protein